MTLVFSPSLSVKQLDEVIQAELLTAIEPYRTGLAKQAAEVLKKQAAGTKPETIRQLQTKVLALRTKEELSKEVYEKRLQAEIQKTFAELRAQANPKKFLSQSITEEELNRQSLDLLSDGKAGVKAGAPLHGN